jgi:hypothetical protein
MNPNQLVLQCVSELGSVLRLVITASIDCEIFMGVALLYQVSRLLGMLNRLDNERSEFIQEPPGEHMKVLSEGYEVELGIRHMTLPSCIICNFQIFTPVLHYPTNKPFRTAPSSISARRVHMCIHHNTTQG